MNITSLRQGHTVVQLQLAATNLLCSSSVHPPETWEDPPGPHLRHKDSATLGLGLRNLHLNQRSWAIFSGLKLDNYWPESWLICPFAGLVRFLRNLQIERLPKFRFS